MTACGLPIETAPICSSFSPIRSGWTSASRVASNGSAAGSKIRYTHIDGYQAVVPQEAADPTAGAVHRDSGFAELVSNEAGDAARAVAALLYLGAVGIEDAIEDIGAVSGWGHQHRRPIGTDYDAAVRDRRNTSAEGNSVPAGATNTMKSLPRPCILVKDRRMGLATPLPITRNPARPARACRARHAGAGGGKARIFMRHVMVMNSKGGSGKSTLERPISRVAMRGWTPVEIC